MPHRQHKTIPNSIRIYREREQLKIYELTKLLELSTPSQVSDWERGFRTPGLENLLKLSIALNVQVSTLYFDLYKELRAELAPKFPHLRHYIQIQ